MKKITLSLLFCFGTLPNLPAQVTIGTTEKPLDGAVLQLKEESGVSGGGANAKKGLMLPRVTLANRAELYPMFNSGDAEYTGTKKDEQKLLHTGLIVFNPVDDIAKGFCKGIYMWSSQKWEKIGENCPYAFRIVSPANGILDFGTSATPLTATIQTNSPKWSMSFRATNFADVYTAADLPFNTEQIGATGDEAVTKTITFTPHSGAQAYVGYGLGGSEETTTTKLEGVDPQNAGTPLAATLTLKRTIPSVYNFSRIVTTNNTDVNHFGENVKVYANTNLKWWVKTNHTALQSHQPSSVKTDLDYGYKEHVQTITIPKNATWNEKDIEVYANNSATLGALKQTYKQKGYTLSLAEGKEILYKDGGVRTYNFTTETSIPTANITVEFRDATSNALRQTKYATPNTTLSVTMPTLANPWIREDYQPRYYKPDHGWIDLAKIYVFPYSLGISSNGYGGAMYNKKHMPYTGSYVWSGDGYVNYGGPAFQFIVYELKKNGQEVVLLTQNIAAKPPGSGSFKVFFTVPQNNTDDTKKLQFRYTLPGHPTTPIRDTGEPFIQGSQWTTSNGVTLMWMEEWVSGVTTPEQAKAVCEGRGLKLPQKADIDRYMVGYATAKGVPIGVLGLWQPGQSYRGAWLDEPAEWNPTYKANYYYILDVWSDTSKGFTYSPNIHTGNIQNRQNATIRCMKP